MTLCFVALCVASVKMSEKLPEKDGKETEESPLVFTEKMLEGDFDDVFRQYPLTEDTQCGFGFLQGKCMQM